MAEKRLSIRLSLQDADVVRRALTQLGTDGQTALKRLETASAAATGTSRNFGAAIQQIREEAGARYDAAKQQSEAARKADADAKKAVEDQARQLQRSTDDSSTMPPASSRTWRRTAR